MSNLNFLPGQTVPNLVIAPVGVGGKVNLYNGSTGGTFLIADVSGYYLSGAPTNAGAFGSVVVASGQAYCWGDRLALGDGKSKGSLVPVAVSTAGVLAGKTVTSVSTGAWTTCAVASGRAYCWGTGNYGEMGAGYDADDYPITYAAVPVAVSTAGVLAGKTVTSVQTGTWTTCAVASGQAYCWGYNVNGQLGNGTTALSYIPVAVSTAGVLAGKKVTAVDIGSYNAVVLAH